MDEAWGGWRPIRYDERCRLRQGELEAQLRELLACCRRRTDIAKVLVFGSFARAAISPWSDLDVLIIADAPDEASSRALAETLRREAVFDGDILAISTARYPEGLSATPFGETILREGREVYARPT